MTRGSNYMHSGLLDIKTCHPKPIDGSAPGGLSTTDLGRRHKRPSVSALNTT